MCGDCLHRKFLGTLEYNAEMSVHEVCLKVIGIFKKHMLCNQFIFHRYRAVSVILIATISCKLWLALFLTFDAMSFVVPG